MGFDGQDQEGVFDQVQAMLQRIAGAEERPTHVHAHCDEQQAHQGKAAMLGPLRHS